MRALAITMVVAGLILLLIALLPGTDFHVYIGPDARPWHRELGGCTQ